MYWMLTRVISVSREAAVNIGREKALFRIKLMKAIALHLYWLDWRHLKAKMLLTVFGVRFV